MENKVLAIVNGTEITTSDLQKVITTLPRERQAYMNSEKGKEELLKQMIDFELAYNHAKEIKIEDTDEFKKQLEATKKQLLIQAAVTNELARAIVSEDELEKYYDENKQKFMTKELISAKHILVETLEDAEKVSNEIQEGMDFAKAAEKYSKCPSKAQGGNLGTFTKGQMVPEFEKAVLALEIGKLSDPIKTQFGYHLIIVDSREESKQKTFDEVKTSINNMLIQQKQTEKYNQFIENLKQKYTVEVK